MTHELPVAKAHAYGNDFLFVPLDRTRGDLPSLARALCDRHTGIGADGLILYSLRDRGATMKLLNADGSVSELSGTGVRCLAALAARTQGLRAGETMIVDTDAGTLALALLSEDGGRHTFRTAIGQPADIEQVQIPVHGEVITATTLRMGNPQCIVLGPLPDAERFGRLGPALSTHPRFPAGTNVEFVQVESPHLVRILIWERGVGPTTSSGTGSSASAVAAAAHGGASRSVEVVAPGGIQSVDWTDDGVFLTGWAEVVMEGHWVRDANIP